MWLKEQNRRDESQLSEKKEAISGKEVDSQFLRNLEMLELLSVFIASMVDGWSSPCMSKSILN